MSTIGYQRITGEPRFWFEVEFLIDGFPLVPMVLGLFAIPEIVSLFKDKEKNKIEDISKKHSYNQLILGAKEAIIRPLLVLRSSIIGAIVGIIPGIGGSIAPYLALSSIKRKDDKPHIEGIIAPESSNNAKEGGSLVPTLALGIPGSAGMVLILSGFMLMGIEPGPDFLKENLDFAIGISWLVAISNIVAAIIVIPVILYLVKITKINKKFLSIMILFLVLLGTYFSQNNIYDYVFLLFFGMIGLLFQTLNYSRPALILGFILGPLLETYLYISMQAYGFSMFERPISIALMLLIIFGFVKAFYGRKSIK